VQASQTDDMEDKAQLQRRVEHIYSEMYGAVTDTWSEQRLADERAQRVLSNKQDLVREYNLPPVQTPNSDTITDEDLSAFETIFFGEGETGHFKYIFAEIYNKLKQILDEKYPDKNLPATIDYTTLYNVGNTILNHLYNAIFPRLGITAEDKYIIDTSDKRSTMTKSSSTKTITLPESERPFSKLITLVFHEIGTHTLKSLYTELYSRKGKISGSLNTEEGFCKLIDAFFWNKLTQEGYLVEGGEQVPLREDNAVYSFVIALTKKGVPFDTVIELVGEWWKVNDPSLAEAEIIKKQQTVVERVFRGCVGMGMANPKDRTYMDGFRIWKQVFERFRDEDEIESKKIISTICDPDLWLSGGFDPFDIDSVSEHMRRAPLIGELNMTKKDIDAYKSLLLSLHT